MNAAWLDVMDKMDKDDRHEPYPDEVANDLVPDEVLTILATMDFFGATSQDIAQARFDLICARYRVFDWLAMGIMGRIECRPAVQVLTHSFLKVDGDVDAFITDLRESDYDIDHSWEEGGSDGGYTTQTHHS